MIQVVWQLFVLCLVQKEGAEAMGKLAALRGIIGFQAPIIEGLLFNSIGFVAVILESLAVQA